MGVFVEVGCVVGVVLLPYEGSHLSLGVLAAALLAVVHGANGPVA